MDSEQIRENLHMSIYFLVSLLKNGWDNVKTMTVKTTMGKPYRLIG